MLLLTLPAEYAQQGLCNCRVSVHPTVCLSHRSTAATGLLLSARCGQEISTDTLRAPCCRRADARQQMRAASRSRLNTDLILVALYRSTTTLTPCPSCRRSSMASEFISLAPVSLLCPLAVTWTSWRAECTSSRYPPQSPADIASRAPAADVDITRGALHLDWQSR